MKSPAIIAIAALLLPFAAAAQQQQTPPTSQQRGTATGLPALPALPQSGPLSNAVDQTLPLTPEEIRQLRKRYIDSRRAAAEPGMLPQRPVTSSVTIDLSPGVTPPVVRVASGQGASIAFFDSTGAGWPVEAFKNFSETEFDVSSPKKELETSVLTANPKTEFASANLAVFLRGLPTPITLTLVAGDQRETDYRFDVRVPLPGPNAKPLPVPVDPRPKFGAGLSQILDGVPPGNARAVKVTGGPVQGWVMDGKLILRTRVNILSPRPSEQQVSADGTYAFEVPYSPVVLFSDDGKLGQLIISGD